MKKKVLGLSNLVLLALVTLFLMYLLSIHILPLGIPGIGMWQWFFRDYAGFSSQHLLIVVCLIISSLAIAYLIERADKSKVLTIFLILLAFGFFLSLSIYLYNWRDLINWIQRVSDMPYYVYAHAQGNISILEALRQYLPSMKSGLNDFYHQEITETALSTHPPGSTLLFMIVDRLARLIWPADLGNEFIFALHAAIIRLLINLVPLGLFAWLVKILTNSRTMLRALFILVFTPSLIYFCLSPSSFEIAFTVLTVAFLHLAIQAKERKFWLWITLASLILAFGTFMNFGLFMLYVLGILYLALNVVYRQLTLKKAAISLVVMIIGLIIWLVFSAVVLNYNYFEGWQQAQIVHHQMISVRKYFPWVIMNLYDFILFIGFPTTMLFCLFLTKIDRRNLQQGLLTVLAILFLGIVNFSGIARGEVARIWLFLIPLFIVSIAAVIDYYRNRLVIFGTLLSLMAIQIMVMKVYVYTIWPLF